MSVIEFWLRLRFLSLLNSRRALMSVIELLWRSRNVRLVSPLQALIIDGTHPSCHHTRAS